MLTVHHLNNSRSQRILWLLEELQAPYEIVRYERDPDTLFAPPELQRVHPLGKSPVVTDGERTLAESGAIIEDLARRYGNGRLVPPPETIERNRYTYFLHYAEGSMMPPLGMKLVFDRIEQKAPLLIRPIAKAISARVKQTFILPNIETHLRFLEGELATRRFLCGDDFTAADVQMSYPLEAAVTRGGLRPDRAKTWAYLEALHARPAYRRALERGGPL